MIMCTCRVAGQWQATIGIDKLHPESTVNPEEVPCSRQCTHAVYHLWPTITAARRVYIPGCCAVFAPSVG